jgi:hypothetical protein
MKQLKNSVEKVFDAREDSLNESFSGFKTKKEKHKDRD